MIRCVDCKHLAKCFNDDEFISREASTTFFDESDCTKYEVLDEKNPEIISVYDYVLVEDTFGTRVGQVTWKVDDQLELNDMKICVNLEDCTLLTELQLSVLGL